MIHIPVDNDEQQRHLEATYHWRILMLQWAVNSPLLAKARSFKSPNLLNVQSAKSMPTDKPLFAKQGYIFSKAYLGVIGGSTGVVANYNKDDI